MSTTAVSPVPESDAGPSLDMDIVAGLREVVGEGFADIVDAFVADVDHLMGRMEEAALSGDPQVLASCAHQLKSSSASLGALRFSELMRQVEMGAREETNDDLTRVLAAAKDELVGARTQLLQAR